MKKTITLLFVIICIVVNTKAQVWKLYTTANGLPSNNVKVLTTDLTGNVWIGTTYGASMFNGTTFTNYSTTQGLSNNYVKSLACDASGTVWLGTQIGLNKNTGSTFIQYHTTDGLIGNNIMALTTSTGGILWAGTTSGLSKYNGTTFTNYTTADGLINNSIVCICTDLTGNVWVGTNVGLSVFNGTTFTNYTTGNGLPSNSIKSLFCDNTGNVWIGTTAGLVKYDGSFTIYTTTNGLLGNSITALSQDNSNNIWISYSIVGVTRYNGVFFTNFNENNGLSYGSFVSIISNGNLVYFGSSNGLIETRKWTIPPVRFDYLDTNNIAAGINSTGLLFERPEQIAGFRVPKNTAFTSIFASSIWLGGFDQNNQLHLAAQGFSNYNNDTWSGPIYSDLNNYSEDSTWNRIWKISKTDIDNHILNYNQPGYIIPLSIIDWPAPTADYIDVNDNNLYDPINGDYPLIRGDQAILTIFNDVAYTHGSGGLPLGVEIHSLSYSFNSTDSALANTVFCNYKVYNYSVNDYHDFYLGIYTDIDVGVPTDDYIGCDSTISLYYVYNATPNDAQYGTNIPAQGVVLLSSPMYSFNYYSNSSGNMGDPSTNFEFYNVLNGYWKDGTPYSYGGNGYGGNVYTNYCFSSYPNIPGGWSEVTENFPPGDRRGVGTVGPFTFNAGTTLCIDVAFPNAIDYSGNNLTSVNPLLKKITSNIIDFYNSQNWSCGEIFADTNTIAHLYTKDTTICKGAPYYFNNIVVGGTPPYSFHWSPSTGLSNDTVLNPIATPSVTTQYVLTATDHLNNVIIDTILLTVFTPYINAGSDTTVCNNETVTLTASPGYVNYDWSCCGYTQSINVNANHTNLGTVNYTVTIYYQSYSCSNSDTVSVTFIPSPNANLGNNITFCKEDSLILNSNTVADHYLWNTGETSSSVLLDGTVLSQGMHTYYVHVWNNNGCDSYDTISVNVVANPTVFAGNDTTVCSNESLILTATAGFPFYQWSCCGNSQSVNVNTNHDYSGIVDFTILIYDINNCSDIDTITVNFLASPDINLGIDTFMCNTDIFTLDAGIGYDNYLWNTGSLLNSITIDGSITPIGIATYWVSVSNNNDCFSSDTIQITNNVCIGINNVSNYGYKVFPNPINKGQLLQIKMPKLSNYNFLLTDVYGKEVFEKKIKNADKFSFPTKLFSAGIYFLKIYSEKENVVYRIIVN
ncbi:MAG: hypothetical protein A2X08_14740 [Bacteroidetes bacterium GWA2_32_17]|nr:MAG: hypothetical protein A2X08_14740 [Bacteroidetes bacterium GWA2_32_17]